MIFVRLMFIGVLFEHVYSSLDRLHNMFLNDLSNILNNQLIYDPSLCPPSTGPLQVNVTMQILSIRDVSEVTMTFRVDIYLLQEWMDERLSQNNALYANISFVSLHKSYYEKLWRPATFFCNVIESVGPPPPDEDSFSHRNGMAVGFDGYVQYYQRLSLTARCALNLRRYPFDYQMCRLELENFESNETKLTYKWSQLFAQTFDLPEYNTLNISVSSGVNDYGGGMYVSQLTVCFLFKRKCRFYFLELFIPAGLIIIVGYIVSIAKQSSIGDIVGVILAELFLYFSYITVMPKVSDFKAMDLYLIICFGFVFAALLVKVYLSRGESEAKKLAPTPITLHSKPKNLFNKNEKLVKESKLKHFLDWAKSKMATFTYQRFVLYALYPISFSVFCFFYFLTFMYIDDDYHGQCQVHTKDLVEITI